MKRTMTRLGAFLVSIILALGSSKVVYADEGYTYNYDYWTDIQYSPDAYEVTGVFTSVDLGLEMGLKTPSGLFVYNDLIYLCDTGNNRILEIKRTDTQKLELLRIIDSFQGGEGPQKFSSPGDIAVSDDGYMFIADTNNNRILKIDMDLNYVMEFTKPTDPTFDQSLSFLPTKLVIDTAGRVYCVATNVNKGLIKFEADGVFSGFIGATPVTYDLKDYLWKRLATQAQRAQMVSFVPTEYDNAYIDHEGFIFVCTTNVTAANLDDGSATPIRRLNMMGSDILIQNGNYPVLGDLDWNEGGGYSGPSLITDITAFENDVYVALDRVRNRLFAYNDQGNMLFAFGGNGNMDGYFRLPSAIDHMGYDLLVLDKQDNSLTIFTPTDFGKYIYQAIDQFQAGNYIEARKSWQKVLELNGNYDLAYIGIGQSLLREEKYKEAMEYFKLKWDDDNYSKAFKQYRKEWVQENIAIIFVLAFGLLIIPLIIGKIRAIKREIDRADIFKDYMQ